MTTATLRKTAVMAIGATLAIGSVAFAGPYPMQQLRKMLDKARAELARVDAALVSCNQELANATAELDALGQQFKKSQTRVDYQRYRDARQKVDELHRRCHSLTLERQRIQEELDSIMVQIQAWEEIEGPERPQFGPHQPGTGPQGAN